MWERGLDLPGQNRIQWRGVEITVMNPRVPQNAGKFWSDEQLWPSSKGLCFMDLLTQELHALQMVYLLTYLLTYYMVREIIWKVDSYLFCQRVACFLYGTRRFIAVLTKARHRTLFWDSRIQLAPSIPVSLRSIWMLSSYLRLGLPSDLFPSGLPTKTL
jgi:hypothetical protein